MLNFVHEDEDYHPPAKLFYCLFFFFLGEGFMTSFFFFPSYPSLLQNDLSSGLGRKFPVLINKMQVFSWSQLSRHRSDLLWMAVCEAFLMIFDCFVMYRREE